MGQCLNVFKVRASGKPESRYLVNDTHQFFSPGSNRDKGARKKSGVQKLSEAYIDSLWISRGMPTARPALSDFNRRVVKESWVFLDPNMLNIGRIVFTKLFAAIPAVKRLFEKQHQLKHADEAFTIKRHAEKVVLAIAKLIKIVDEPHLMEVFLHDLGGRHAEYNVRIEYLDCFIPFFIQAIHPVLKDKWASSIEDAWAAFFRRTLHVMKEAVVF